VLNGFKINHNITGINESKRPLAENVQYVYLINIGVTAYKNPIKILIESFLKKIEASIWAVKKLRIPKINDKIRIEYSISTPESWLKADKRNGAALGYEKG
jgi:hypothetical protein